jgi:hypothetical protein
MAAPSLAFKRHVITDLRLHDLRGSHATVLDSGIGAHTVAERLGHDPAVLPRDYAPPVSPGGFCFARRKRPQCRDHQFCAGK